MKLEYLPDGSPDAPLIRLYDFDQSEIDQLRECFADIAEGRQDIIAIHEQDFIEPIASCKLWIAEHADRLEDENAVLPTSEKDLMFTWMMKKDEWNETIELLGTYSLSPDSYQWLTDDLGIQILISVSGEW